MVCLKNTDTLIFQKQGYFSVVPKNTNKTSRPVPACASTNGEDLDLVIMVMYSICSHETEISNGYWDLLKNLLNWEIS